MNWERVFVSRVTEQDMPKLRIIAINNAHYWLQRVVISATGQFECSKLWYLREAMEGPTESQQIDIIMSDKDWDFLTSGDPIIGNYEPLNVRYRANWVVFARDGYTWDPDLVAQMSVARALQGTAESEYRRIEMGLSEMEISVGPNGLALGVSHIILGKRGRANPDEDGDGDEIEDEVVKKMVNF